MPGAEHLVVVDGDLKIIYLNNSFCARCRGRRGELVGRGLEEFFQQDGCEALRRWLGGEAGGRPPQLRLRERAGDDLARELAWSLEPLAAGGAGPAAVVLSASQDPESEADLLASVFMRRAGRLISDSHLAVSVSNTDGKLVVFNLGLEHLSGYSREEVLGKLMIYDLFADLDDLTEALRQLEEEGFVANRPMMLKRKAGSLHPVRVSLQPIADAGEQAVGLMMIALDRSGEFSIAAELESHYRQLERFSAITAEVISIEDSDHLFQQIANAITEISDFSRVLVSIFTDEPPYRRIIAHSGIEEEVFRKLRDIPMDRRRFRDFMQEEFRLGANCFYIPGERKGVFKEEEVVYGTLGSGGEEGWSPDDNLVVTLMHGGELLGFISVDDSKSGRQPTSETVRPLELFANQITQVVLRNRLEQELRQRHRDLQLLHEISVIVNSSLDAEEVLQRLVKTIHERLDQFFVSVYLLEDNLLTKRAAYGSDFEIDTIRLGEGIIGAAAREGKVVIAGNVRADERYLAADPETRSEIAVPIKSTAIVDGEEIESVIGVLNVESDRHNAFTEDDGRRLEAIANTASVAIENTRLMNRVLALLKEEANYSQELEQSKADLDEFVYTISHDLKSPLNSIKGYADMMELELKSGGEAEVRRFLERISANAEVVARMINDLLELSRVGKMAEERTEVSPRRLLEEILFDLRASGEGAEVRLRTEGLPEEIRADPRRLAQLFTNLIVNAYKYRHPERDPAIVISCRDMGDHYVFAVADNGIGIDPKHLHSIFTFGVRLRETKAEGSGAGLAIAKKIVETGGGRIWAESTKGEGEGSTFFFTLAKEK